MNKLSIFWYAQESDRFYWTLGDSNASKLSNNNESTAIHLLESQQLLKADLASLADSAQGKSVELIVANTDIHSALINLPNKAQRHMRKAVPFLLEEQLAENVDDTFIAIGDRLASGQIPVRGIKLNYLENILNQFKLAEIKLNQVRVDLDLIAAPEAGFNVAMLQDQVLVCEQDNHKWSCHQDDFSWLVQKRLAEKLNTTASNDKNASAVPDQLADEIDMAVALPLKIIAQDETASTFFEKQLPVGVFAAQIELVDSVEDYLVAANDTQINLLQGQFEQKTENTANKSMLLRVASIVGIVLASHIIYQGSQIISLEQQKASLAKQRNALFKQAFPGRRVTSNPDKTLRTYLRDLKGGEGDSSFLAMLESSSAQINNASNVYPTNISFDASRNELRMDVIAKDLPTLNAFRDRLRNSGHQVDMSSASQRGEGYSSRLIIRK
jgi:general secretion pathway protein L